MALASAAVLAGIGVLALSWLALTPWLVLAGIGMGMISGCIPPVTVAQVDRDHAGAASALLKTGQQLGSALGVAAAGSIYFAWALDGAMGGGMPPSQAAMFVIVALLLVCAGLAARLPSDIFAARPAQGH